MEWTKSMREFIQAHIDDDTASLLLAAHRWPEVDVPVAVEQIEARRQLKGKLPTWYAQPDLIMGGRLAAEQCSSEQTARYKRSLVEGTSLCDLTGGMGVDFWYMSEGLTRAIYTERQPHLCEAARHNFAVLADGKHPEPEIRCGDGQKLPIPSVDFIYLDPARRATDGSRVFAIDDCEPNLLEWQDQLLAHAKTVLVKLSPMIDLTDTLRKLHHVTEVHVVAVRNECKEVLVKLSPTASPNPAQGGATIHCIDFLADRTIKYTFSPLAPCSSPLMTCTSPLAPNHYLYDPDVTLMKAQAWGSLCQRFPVSQLAHDTHLFTSLTLLPDFPGRIFVIDEVLPFSSKLLKQLRRQVPQANIATRNLSLTADQLRQRTGIRDGGSTYIFVATSHTQGPIILICHKPFMTTSVQAT